MKKLWVLTTSFNDYDQHGDYLVSVFIKEPTRAELLILLYGGTGEHGSYEKHCHVLVSHILKGGGRIATEGQWYHLAEIIPGKPYQSFND